MIMYSYWYKYLLIQLLFGIAYCSKTPLTVVNPLEIVREKLNALKWSSSYDSLSRSYVNDLPNNVIKTVSKVLSNDSCGISIKKIANDTSMLQSYSLEILDSWGKVESGVLEGNIFWEGRYYECLAATDGDEIFGQYCAISLAIPNSLNPFGTATPSAASIGVCFPDKCSAENISAIFQSFLPPQIFQGTTCVFAFNSWEPKDILGLTILCILTLLVILSSAYECWTSSKYNSSMALYGKIEVNDNSVQLNNELSVCHRVMMSFSIIRNTKRLLDTTQRPNDINCLHGLRFLSMTWVLLGHATLFQMNYADNLKFMAKYVVNHYEFQVITNAFFSVDSFFFLSGLLVVYLGLRQLNRRQGRMNVPLMFFHRYLRLTPPYAFLILMSISLWPKLGAGPFWSLTTESIVTTCQKYWYTNLLYFNNLYPSTIEKECFAWGWYLANDTQFYLLAPLFLWALYKSPKIGLGLISFFLSSSIAITGAFSSHTNQQPTAMLYGLLAKAAAQDPSFKTNSTLVADNALGDDDTQTSYSPYMLDLYGKPWCRIGAYLIGMLTGYFLYTYKNIKMNKITVFLGWTASTIVCLLLVYCCFPYYSKGNYFSNNLAAFYNAMSRPVWCVGLAWLTIACVNGYGGPVNKLLSWKAFIPLSRLTYCTYLIHPLVLEWFSAAVEVQPHYSIYFIVTQFLFALLMTSLLAYIVAMLSEFPFIELLKILQSGKQRYDADPPKNENSDQNPLLVSSA